MAVRDAVESFVGSWLVPALLLIGLLAAGISAGQAYPRARAAAYGGFWAGVLAVAVLVLVLQDTPLGRPHEKGLPWTVGELLGGAGLGAWTTLGYIWFRDRAWIAIPLALQAGGSLGLLYLFLIWHEARPDIAWVTVGIAPAAALFYTLFRDEPPKPRRPRERPRVPATPDAARGRGIVNDETPGSPS